MDKENVVRVCIYNGLLLSHKKYLNNIICSNMDGHRDCHTEWSKSHRENQIWYHLYMESKKNGTNKLTYKSEIKWKM